MNTARYYHTATLLPTGKVLVAGGEGTGSAELYDYASGTWTTTNAMTSVRVYHTATLLASGKVLVAGGFNGSTYLTSAELYDPATGTWALTGSMTTNRAGHTATLLANGKVLVAAGQGAGGNLASAELYDPASGKWTTTGTMTTNRIDHTATLLANGQVLVAAGYNGSTYLTSAELYDPASGKWTLTGSLTYARWHHTATLLLSGKVLVAGGSYGSTYWNTCEVYDPGSGTWTASGLDTLNTTRDYHTATLLPNGKVLVAGGQGSGGGCLTSAELYDLDTGWGTGIYWTGTGPMPTARGSHTATLLPNGKVLVAGGDCSYTAVANAELYDVGLGFSASWQPQVATFTSPLCLGRSLKFTGSGFRGVSEGASGSDGGQNSPADHPVVQLRSLGNEQTTFLLGTGWQTNSFTSAPVSGLPGGYVLATVYVNGIPSTGSILNFFAPPTLSILKQGTNVLISWVTCGGTTNWLEATSGLAGGGNPSDFAVLTRIIPAAGTGQTGTNYLDVGGADGMGAWTLAGALNTARSGHTATLLGTYWPVLFAGGQGEGGVYLSSAEWDYPDSGTWLTVNSMKAARSEHTATMLANGNVLVAGGLGTGGAALATAELYNVGNGTWTTTGSMGTARYEHQAVLLGNGQVLVVGGNSGSGYLGSAELYNPGNGTWTPTNSLATARMFHSATLLPSGKVLVAGGYNGGPLASAELYDPASGTWSATGSMTTNRYYHRATLLPSGRCCPMGRCWSPGARSDRSARFLPARSCTIRAAGSGRRPAR